MTSHPLTCREWIEKVLLFKGFCSSQTCNTSCKEYGIYNKFLEYNQKNKKYLIRLFDQQGPIIKSSSDEKEMRALFVNIDENQVVSLLQKYWLQSEKRKTKRFKRSLELKSFQFYGYSTSPTDLIQIKNNYLSTFYLIFFAFHWGKSCPYKDVTVQFVPVMEQIINEYPQVKKTFFSSNPTSFPNDPVSYVCFGSTHENSIRKLFSHLKSLFCFKF